MRNIIKKRNDFILGRFNISLIEQKILLLGISQINKDDEEFTYKIKIDHIDSDFVKHNNFSKLKTLTKKLMLNKVIELPSKNSNYWEYVHLVNRCGYDGKNKEVFIEFDKTLIPYLLDFRNQGFTKYHIKNVMNFKSGYSIRFYELLKKEVFRIGKKKFIDVNYELEYLFDIFKVPKSLQKISKFRTEILERVKKEINSFSDISIEYDLIKIGRKYREINFRIRNNIQIMNVNNLKTSKYYQKKIKEIEEERKKGLNNEQSLNHSEEFENYVEYTYETYINHQINLNKYLIDNNEVEIVRIEKNSRGGIILTIQSIENIETISKEDVFEVNPTSEIMINKEFDRGFEELFYYLEDRVI